MNKKNLMLALGMLAVGATASVAAQSFAQTPPADNQTASVEAKDAQGNDIETNDDGDHASEKVTTPIAVSEDQAKQIAIDANQGTQVTTVELEQHRGQAVYEVALDNKVEVKIDANSGAVLKSHQEGDEKNEAQGGQDESGENGTETQDDTQ